MAFNGGMFFFGALQLLNLGLMLAAIGCSIYGFILFVKLATRGIKALDIYIKNNNQDGHGY